MLELSALLAAILVVSIVTPAAGAEIGYASHYGPGDGVAMHFCTWTLRHTQGCGSVAITSLQTGITVTAPVIDYCECVVPGSSQPVRIVDLQYGVVDALGLNLEAGLYQVSVERIDAPLLPNTASQGPEIVLFLIGAIIGSLFGWWLGEMAARCWYRR